MPRDALFRFLRQRLGWLLGLALLLPVAQLATAAHAAVHGAETSRPADAKAHLQHCPLCTAAAVLAGDALPGTPAHLALADADRFAPAARPVVAWVATTRGLPANRGPPLLLP